MRDRSILLRAWGALLLVALTSCERNATAPAEDVRVAEPSRVFEAIAGEYWRGSSGTWSESITINATGAYEIDFGGCVGPNDTSDVAVLDGNIVRLNDHRKGVTGDGVLKHLVAVPWGERTYLVRADKGIDFCNAVNDGREPRDGKLDSSRFS